MIKLFVISKRSRRLLWTIVLLISPAEAFYVTSWTRMPAALSRRHVATNRTTPRTVSMVLESTQKPIVFSERNIVTLGRRGKTDEAIAVYKSIERPTVRQMNGAIDACARARPPRLDEAFQLFEDGIAHKSITPNVFTFGALMSACSRARRADRAIQVLREMQTKYGVQPNNVVYSSAISACARTDPADYKLALQLLEEASTKQQLAMNVVGYNAALDACARAGAWEPAIQLLQQMESSELMPIPDAVTYGTILSACERGEQWDLVLKYAHRLQERNLALDGLSLTSILHACQQLGMAQDAIQYLELMKHSAAQSERKTAGWQRTGVRQPLNGPDGVAYRLAISACARGGLWEDGIRLLEELRQVDSVDVIAYTATITGCEYAGEWKRAFQLLEMMRKDGVEPNEVTMASVIGACATACANAAKKDDDPKLPQQKALQLLRVMKKDQTVVDPNIVVYNAAIRACGEAMDLDSAFKLLNELEEDGLEPTVVTYGSLMTACERVGDMDGASKVFKRMRAADIAPNEIIYGAAISCCRKAGNPERALLLLRKMIREGLSPNVATFNTVIVAQTEGRKADLQKGLLIYKLMKSKYSKAHPSRQTYNLLIRSLAANQEPIGAEAFLRKMRLDGFIPDVDLYTATVTAYEKNGQPLRALRLMESMQEDGYDFYDIQVLNAAFKKAVKLVSAVGRGLSSDDNDVAFDIDGKEGEDDEFIGGQLLTQ